MKTLFSLIMIFAFCSVSYAQSPFNGNFCGRGEVTIQGQKREGSKTVELTVTSTDLHFMRDHTDFDDGSYMDGRSEDAVISGDNIVYNGSVVGTISSSELQTQTTLAGYKIAYTIMSLEGFVSYVRTSDSGSWYMDEDFPELKPCPIQR